MNRAEIEVWVDDLRLVWERADPVQMGELFTDDAQYQPYPFGPPLRGRRSIVAYWGEEMSNQEKVEVRMGRPVIDGDRVAVEWWAVMTNTDDVVTDSGALILELSGDRCQRLREYWMLADGRIEFPEGWGT